MDDLKNVMRVIDKNSDKLPEGDYLELCNLLRNVFRNQERKEMNNLFDYENFHIHVNGQSDDVLDYFYDIYFQTSLDNECMFLKSQMTYLESELEIYRPIQRISKNVKLDAIRHYCSLNKISIRHYTPDTFREYQMQNNLYTDEKKFQKGLRNICKGFIHMENTYRTMYRGIIMDRIEKIEGWMEEIQDM
jgi:hypothetical protein